MDASDATAQPAAIKRSRGPLGGRQAKHSDAPPAPAPQQHAAIHTAPMTEAGYDRGLHVKSAAQAAAAAHLRAISVSSVRISARDGGGSGDTSPSTGGIPKPRMVGASESLSMRIVRAASPRRTGDASPERGGGGGAAAAGGVQRRSTTTPLPAARALSVSASDGDASPRLGGVPQILDDWLSGPQVPCCPEAACAVGGGGGECGLWSAPTAVPKAATPVAAAWPPPAPPPLERLRAAVYGADHRFDTPFGRKAMLFADHAASGRLVEPVDTWLAVHAYPAFANVHSEVGHCAQRTGKLLEGARNAVAAFCSAPRDDFAVIFVGSGCTGAVQKFAHLMGVHPRAAGPGPRRRRDTPVVLVTTMEHHSNVLFWREMHCILEVIPEGPDGGPDLGALEATLLEHARAPLILASFSAGSNVTGIVPDHAATTRLLHKHGAVSAWDYAAGATCCEIVCSPGGGDLSGPDAVYLSPHKFAGGPGSCGVLVVRRSVVRAATPSLPGGGTVAWVTKSGHKWHPELEAREEGGTPNIIGAMRAALAFQIQADLGVQRMHGIAAAYALRAIRVLGLCPAVRLHGASRGGYTSGGRLPIVSFSVTVRRPGGEGWRMLHPHFVSAVLNDVYGIQSRSGCSCAGPYGVDLLRDLLATAGGRTPEDIVADLEDEDYQWLKPGWCRVTFSHMMSPAEVDYIIRAVLEVARDAWKLLPQYAMTRSGTFVHCAAAAAPPAGGDTGLEEIQSAVAGMLAPGRCEQAPPPPAAAPPGKARASRDAAVDGGGGLTSAVARGRRLWASVKAAAQRRRGDATEAAAEPPTEEAALAARAERRAAELRRQGDDASAAIAAAAARTAAGHDWWAGAAGAAGALACPLQAAQRSAQSGRWMLLPHEAAAALRARQDLSWVAEPGSQNQVA